MKKLLIVPAVALVVASCGAKKEERHATTAETAQPDRVELIYFHGKMRCASCQAIEKYAREAVDSLFADQHKAGKVMFRTVDISTPEGEAVADGYEVSSSSFFVNKWENGKETRNNLTEFGFATARNSTQEFKDSVVAIVRKSLK